MATCPLDVAKLKNESMGTHFWNGHNKSVTKLSFQRIDDSHEWTNVVGVGENVLGFIYYEMEEKRLKLKINNTKIQPTGQNG